MVRACSYICFSIKMKQYVSLGINRLILFSVRQVVHRQRHSKGSGLLSGFIRLRPLQHSIRVLDTSHVAFLDPLDRQCRNQSCTNAGTILCSSDIDLVSLALFPIKNLAQRNRASCFEVRVLVKYRPISTNMAGFDVLLLADSRYSASRKTSCTSSNEFGETSEKLCFRLSNLEAKLVLEEVLSFCQIRVRVSVSLY